MIRTIALAAALAAATPAFAQDVASFIVTADEGYGVDACLQNADGCAAAVAKGWCVASGYDRAIDYRQAVETDITGSAGVVAKVAANGSTGAVVITCER